MWTDSIKNLRHSKLSLSVKSIILLWYYSILWIFLIFFKDAFSADKESMCDINSKAFNI